MKITRKTLLIIIAFLGIVLIAYAAVRHFNDSGEEQTWDRYVTNSIVIIALGLYLYNRKLARDEKLAKEAIEEPKYQIEEGPEEEPKCQVEEEPEEDLEDDTSQDDENLPHWERKKN
jgi:hypothetical protein